MTSSRSFLSVPYNSQEVDINGTMFYPPPTTQQGVLPFMNPDNFQRTTYGRPSDVTDYHTVELYGGYRPPSSTSYRTQQSGRKDYYEVNIRGEQYTYAIQLRVNNTLMLYNFFRKSPHICFIVTAVGSF